jgi:ribose/xylose/arabinose/galactoside ABC-type transport system permease subunit
MSIDRRILTEAIAPLVLFVLLFAGYAGLKGGRIGAFELHNLLVSGLPLVFVALGQYWIVLTREIDLSLGPLVSIVTCLLALAGGTIAAGLLGVGVLIAIAVGLGNGTFVTRLRAPSVIVTLGTMTLLQGVALLVLPAPSSTVPTWLTGGFGWKFGLLSTPLLMLAAVLLACITIGSTRFAVAARAVGLDAAAARLNGIDVGRIRRVAFVLGALFALLSGVVLTAATYSGAPSIGNSYILSSLTAVVVGGVALSGGRGSPLGVILGCYSLTVLANILYLAHVPSYFQSLVEGCVLLAAVSLSLVRMPRHSRKEAAT